MHAQTLETLNISLNPLGDTPNGAMLLEGLTENKSVTTVGLSACDFGHQTSGRAFINLLKNNSTLTSIDLSCNQMFQDPSIEDSKEGEGSEKSPGLDEELEAEVVANKSLHFLDLRLNPVEPGSLRNIKKILTKRTAEKKRELRKQYQKAPEHWDTAY